MVSSLQWLLWFLGLDIFAVRPGAWKDLAQDVTRHLNATLPKLDIEILHGMLTAGLARVGAGKAWQPLDGRDLIVCYVKIEDGKITRYYTGNNSGSVALATAIDLLTSIPLSLCDRPTCGKYFTPSHGNQKFHDANCASLSRRMVFKNARKAKKVAK